LVLASSMSTVTCDSWIDNARTRAHTLIQWLQSQRGHYDLIYASITINLLSLALPLVTLQVYDRVLAYQNISTLRVLMIGAFVFILLELSMRIARSYLTGRTAMQYEYNTSCTAMRRVLYAKDQQASRNVSEFMQDFAAIGKTRDFHGGQALSTLLDLPFIMVFIGLIAYLAGWLVLVPIFLLFLFTLLVWLMGDKLKQSLLDREANDDKRFGFIIESLLGIHTIKSMSLEALMQRRYEGFQERTALINYHVSERGGAVTITGQLFSQLMLVCVVTAGAPMVIYGIITTGTLIACMLLSGRIMQPVQRTLQLWTRFQDYRVSESRVNNLFSLTQQETLKATGELRNNGDISCSNVSYGFDPQQAMLLQDISLELKTGDTIAISGSHSSGKTTLLKLMAGIHAPLRGRVLVNGVDACALPSRELVKHVGYIPTEGVIYRGTIMENLTGMDAHKRGKALEIASLMGIDTAVARLARGYDTRLEGGNVDVIPPGLRQRIAIGRVLLEKPRILLFDNADRALDHDGYNHMFELLGKLKGRTTIVLVSDDKNIQQLADRVYTIRGGQMVEVAQLTGITR
ncbi:MAG: peptidase domain-containing ABC transporter, partial [Alphaproteobacteria bacterium]